MAEEGKNNLFEDFDFGIFDTEEQSQEEENTEEQTEEGSQEQNDDENSSEDTSSSDSTEEENNDDETEESEESSEESKKETDDNSSPLLPYAKLLVDEGILPNLNLAEFDGTSTGLMEAMNKEINSGVEYYKSSLPEEISKLIENYEEGVPLSHLLDIDQDRKQYKSISEEQIKDNKDLQKSIVKEYYKQTTKFTDEKIDKLIQRSEDLEELEEESKNSLKELVSLQDEYEKEALENAKIEKEESLKKQEAALNEFKTTLENYTEVIPGIKINKNIKDNILKTMTTPIAYDEQGIPLNEISKYRIENPYKFDIILSYLFNTTKSFTDWSVLSSAGRSDAIKDFEKAVGKQEDRSSGKTDRIKQKQTKDDLLSAITSFNLGK